MCGELSNDPWCKGLQQDRCGRSAGFTRAYQIFSDSIIAETFGMNHPVNGEERIDVLERLIHNGMTLRHLSEAQKDDQEFALAAVSNNWHALQFVSPRLRDNRVLVLRALQGHSNALMLAGACLNSDREIMKAAVTGNGFFLER